MFGIRVDYPEHMISRTRDLLSSEVHDSLIDTCALDGIIHGQAGIEQRERWFNQIWDELSQLDIQARPEGLPKDLKYMAALARGICGAGLPTYRMISQFSFLTDIDEAPSLDMPSNDRVVIPLRGQTKDGFNELLLAWAAWQIAVGIRTWDRPRGWGGGHALFCRRTDLNRSEWRWRYGLQVQPFETELHDSVEEFLGWYAHFREQTEGNIEIEPLESIL